MKKNLILVLFLSMFLILAGCGSKTTDVNESLNWDDVAVNDSSTNEESFESTMEEVYKKWGKMTCTMNTIEDGVEMNGVLYIDWKKFRSDVKWSVEGMNFEMSTVIKDDYSYSWNNMSKEWMKFPYEEDMDDGMEEWMNDAATDTDMDSKMAFKCKKGIEWWDVFELPSNIKFSEMPEFNF